MSELIFFGLGIFIGVISAFAFVTENDWAQGQEKCSVNGGLKSFRVSPADNPKVTCVNGAYFILKEVAK
jgi:hypothetical protein